MSKTNEPNPPTGKDEEFPKTNTIPEGWVMEELTDAYNPHVVRDPKSSSPVVPPTGGSKDKSNGSMEARSAAEEDLFRRRLNNSPQRGDEHGMWL